MSGPTRFEREYYAKLVGRTIRAIRWEDFEGKPLPVLILDGKDRKGQPAFVTVLMDPEGNGPGHLDHNL